MCAYALLFLPNAHIYVHIVFDVCCATCCRNTSLPCQSPAAWPPRSTGASINQTGTSSSAAWCRSDTHRAHTAAHSTQHGTAQTADMHTRTHTLTVTYCSTVHCRFCPPDASSTLHLGVYPTSHPPTSCFLLPFRPVLLPVCGPSVLALYLLCSVPADVCAGPQQPCHPLQPRQRVPALPGRLVHPGLQA